MQLGYHMPTEQLAPDNAFVLGFIQVLVRAAAQRGHHILVFTEHGGELEAFGELVTMRGVDGFILSGSRMDVIATELMSRCLREIDDGPTGAPGLLVPTEIAVGPSA